MFVEANIKNKSFFIIWCRYDYGTFNIERPHQTFKIILLDLLSFLVYVKF